MRRTLPQTVVLVHLLLLAAAQQHEQHEQHPASSTVHHTKRLYFLPLHKVFFSITISSTALTLHLMADRVHKPVPYYPWLVCGGASVWSLIRRDLRRHPLPNCRGEKHVQRATERDLGHRPVVREYGMSARHVRRSLRLHISHLCLSTLQGRLCGSMACKNRRCAWCRGSCSTTI